MAKENYRRSLQRLADGTLGKVGKGVEIYQAAKAYSDEVGPLFDTETLMLYDYAMGFFDGDEDDLLDFLRAYCNEDEDEVSYLLGEG